ncbi:hypothetical protein [Nocardioides sp.]|uniref:hypothetical protein n=1 Tax=Nocardioides sp. TaxID=35761 RepID=UPI0039E6A11D
MLAVISYNIRRKQTLDSVAAEAARLAALPDAGVIGWQEAFDHREALEPLGSLGWHTAYFDPATEVPISWRDDLFELVDTDQTQMHEGWPGLRRDRIKPGRHVTQVTLRHRASGQLLSVLNTHVTSRAQDRSTGGWRDRTAAERARQHLAHMAGMWRRVPGRWAIATTDLNIDHAQDAAAPLPGGPRESFAGLAVSNWDALGTLGPTVTMRATGEQWVYDYVFAARRCLEDDTLAFDSQELLDGFNSDHLPLLVRFRLS